MVSFVEFASRKHQLNVIIISLGDEELLEILVNNVAGFVGFQLWSWFLCCNFLTVLVQCNKVVHPPLCTAHPPHCNLTIIVSSVISNWCAEAFQHINGPIWYHWPEPQSHWPCWWGPRRRTMSQLLETATCHDWCRHIPCFHNSQLYVHSQVLQCCSYWIGDYLFKLTLFLKKINKICIEESRWRVLQTFKYVTGNCFAICSVTYIIYPHMEYGWLHCLTGFQAPNGSLNRFL